MGIPKSLLFLHHRLLPLLALALAAAAASSFLPTASGDLFSLVYKGCANQSFSSSAGILPQQSLAALSSALISKSSTSKFYKSTSSGLFGLYQCRGDLNPSDCAACVGRLPSMWVGLCGQSSAAARVQLTGCYGLYEVTGFPQVSGTKMLYKTCSSGNGGGGFEQRRDTAFASLQSGVAASGVGFYATSYASVYAMAQCEGDLSVADCGECVAEAVQKAEVECGGASSGQMYLDKCYISYSYYSHGVPHDYSGGGGGGSGTYYCFNYALPLALMMISSLFFL